MEPMVGCSRPSPGALVLGPEGVARAQEPRGSGLALAQEKEAVNLERYHTATRRCFPAPTHLSQLAEFPHQSSSSAEPW